MNFLARLMSSTDRSVEAHIVLSIVGIGVFIGLSCYHVIMMHLPFDPNAFGDGIAKTFAGTGALAVGQGVQRRMQGNGE